MALAISHRFLKHASSGRIYPWTEALAERVDMLPYSGPDPFAKKRKGAPRPSRAAIAAATASVVKDTGEPARVDPRVAQAQAEADAKEKFEAEFGRAPHPNMKLETIHARLAEAEAERLIAAEQVPIPSQQAAEGADEGDTGDEGGEGGFGFGDDAGTQEA